MPVYIHNKEGYLHIEIRSGGRRSWKSLGLHLTGDPAIDKETLKLADVIRAREEARLVSGEYGLIDQAGGKQALYEFAQLVAKDSAKIILRKSLPYIHEFFGDRQIASVDEVMLEAYRDFLLGRPTLAQITASHYFQAIRGLLARAERDRHIMRSPGSRVKGIPIPEPMKVFLTPEELGRLSNARPGGKLGAEISRAFLFACMTGLRKSDILSLQWGDIIETPSRMILKRQVKTKVKVGVPINDSAWSLIEDCTDHKANELVFPKLTESKTDAHEYFRIWERNAGVEKSIGWHTARHTFAVLALQGGADIFTVSKLLGHTSLETTMVYAKATDQMKRAAVEGLPEVKLGEQINRYKKNAE